MKALTQPSEAFKRYGTEPIVLVTISWGGIDTRHYGDKSINNWDGRILSFSGVQSQVTASNRGMVSQSRLELDDHDDTIKTFFNIRRVEGSRVWVYQYFAGADGSPMLIQKGRISTPIKWSEGRRTISFDIVSDITSTEIGYSIREDEFGPLNEVGVGKAWPLVFGHVAHVPAPLVQRNPVTELFRPISLIGYGQYFKLLQNYNIEDVLDPDEPRDPTDLHRITQADLEEITNTDIDDDELSLSGYNRIYLKDPSLLPTGNIKIEIDGVIFEGHVDGNEFVIDKANAAKWVNLPVAARQEDDPDYNNPKVIWLTTYNNNIDLIGNFVYIDSTYKPYRRAEAEVRQFENQCVRQEGLKCWFKYPFKGTLPNGKPVPNFARWKLLDETNTIAAVHGVSRTGLKLDAEELIDGVEEKLLARRQAVKGAAKKDGSSFSPIIRQLELINFIKESYWSAPQGSVVRQWDNSVGDIYVANMVASQSVNGVYGIRTDTNGKQIFAPIPKSYYTINLSRATGLSDGPSVATTVEFKRPLESHTDDKWQSDQIYVTLRSSVAPTGNVTDILEYILDNYTDLTTAAGFSSSNAYPANFALLETKDALQLAQEIAYQACYGLRHDGNNVELIDLRATPSNTITLNTTNVEFQSMEMEYIGLDQLKTIIRARWSPTFAPDIVDEGVIRYTESREQISVFGKLLEETEYFIYNNSAAVKRSIDFWAYRLGNSWRILRVKAFTNAIGVEVFDAVGLGFGYSLLGTHATKGLVIGVHNNVHDASVELTILIPSAAGTDTAAFGFWPGTTDFGGTNPATLISEADYFVSVNYQDKATIQEVMRELRKLEDSTLQLAKVKEIDPNNYSRLLVDIYEMGPFEDPTIVDVWTHDVNPHHNISIGDWVEIKDGQDGVSYATRFTPQPFLGRIKVAEGSTTNRTSEGQNNNGSLYRVEILKYVGGEDVFTHYNEDYVNDDTSDYEGEGETLPEVGTSETREGPFVQALNLEEAMLDTTLQGWMQDNTLVYIIPTPPKSGSISSPADWCFKQKREYIWARVGQDDDTDQLDVNRWEYQFVEQVPDKLGKWKDATIPITGTAYNTFEANNIGVGPMGNGDNSSTYPAGYRTRPVGAASAKAVLQIFLIENCEGQLEFQFSHPNVAGGVCTT